MALVMPLLLIIMMGSAEVGNYFMNEHTLVKAVRDGARYAARQSFTNYTGCSGAPGGTVVADTRNVVVNGYLSGGTRMTPGIVATDVNLAVSCVSAAGGQNMLGIYRSRFGATCNGSSAGGCAQVVTVTAQLTYRPILASFGFRGVGVPLNASSQAAVTGA
ncbi:pilus assembly protein [Sphingomonas sp. SM33]|uniref:Pilus assembly protein n=2 Tax=Sphingomonas telluris TaxID=2907998 RepID=A0ABS9VIH1_9SPHN|nr:pilus assembly protein [Sphingomonas telluris]